LGTGFDGVGFRKSATSATTITTVQDLALFDRRTSFIAIEGRWEPSSPMKISISIVLVLRPSRYSHFPIVPRSDISETPQSHCRFVRRLSADISFEEISQVRKVTPI
jgi:hypothetical protein